MNKVKQIFLKNRQSLIIAVSVILLIISVINIYFTVEVNTQSNDECLWQPKRVSPDSIAIYFGSVKVNGVSWNAGIRDGDQLIAIKGITLENTNQAQRILNDFEVDSFAEYTVKRNGQFFTTNVQIKKLINIGLFATNLIGLIWLIIGFVVLMAKPDGFVQKLFYAVGVGLVLSSLFVIIINSDAFFKSFPIMGTIISYLSLLGACFTPFLLLYFFWYFPKPFNFIEKKWVKILIFIVPAILFIVLFLLGNLAFFLKTIDPMVFQAGLNFLRVISTICQFAAFISLTINYKKLETQKEKKPVLIILIAFIIAIAAGIYTATIAPAISDTIYNSPEYYTPIILIVLVPLAFGYSIFKYQLMDVSIVIKNAIVYGLATLTVAAIYFFVIYIIGQSIGAAVGTQYQGIIAGIFFVVFAIVFQSTKDKFQDFLTARFYPEQFAYQKVLLKFSNDISTVVGLDNILDSMKETFINTLKINEFGIFIREKNDDNLKLVRSVGISNTDLIITKSNIIQFIKEKSLITKNISIEREDFINVFPDQASQLLDEKIYTIIPMIIKSKVVGLLLFGLKHSGSQFAGKDLELLNASANQASIAIENARLYKTENEKIRIERELDLARNIQQRLLPKIIPNFPKLDICGEMIPAMQVGGDYFDLIQVSPSQLFVIVGDVSGKGLPASLHMTRLQTIMQLSCINGRTPKEILIEVNKRIYTSIERNSFVTMTIALFDIEKMSVKFCRAGHMPILAADNGCINIYKSQGLGIGLEKGLIFEKTLIEEEVPLTAGQIYAFYSDGITEAMNDGMDLFGEENLSGILKNKTNFTSLQIMNEVWNSIKVFKGNAHQNDDMTMVLVKVK